MARRLYRRPREAVLGGVAAGLGEYFDVDPVLVRLGFLVLLFAGGLGVLTYLVCWIVIPPEAEAARRPGEDPSATAAPGAAGQEGETAGEASPPSATVGYGDRGQGHGRQVAAVALIVAGVFFLARDFLPLAWLRLSRLWPLVLIAAGLLILVRARGSSRG
jgi:phage shock protein PspC (stress-responsive transcriptional regulator)